MRGLRGLGSEMLQKAIEGLALLQLVGPVSRKSCHKVWLGAEEVTSSVEAFPRPDNAGPTEKKGEPIHTSCPPDLLTGTRACAWHAQKHTKTAN